MSRRSPPTSAPSSACSSRHCRRRRWTVCAPRTPVDAWGLGWDRDRFRQILEALLDDPTLPTIALGVDATAGGGGDTPITTQIAEICVSLAKQTDKRLVLFNNATGNGLNPAVAALLGEAGIPYLAGMRTALAVLAQWAAYGERRARAAAAPVASALAPHVGAALRRVRTLDDVERFRLLREVGVPTVDVVAVRSADEAIAAAERLGYPVAVKASGSDVAHKTERGLVRLGLADAPAVKAAFEEIAARAGGRASTLMVQPMCGPGVELIVGVRNDPAFGSLTVVGLGGVYVELLREAAIRVGPVGLETAVAMLRETRAATLLDGFRGAGPFDLDAAVRAVVALSAFGAATQDVVGAVEINPLIVLPRGGGAVAVDVVLEAKGG